jgi:hypothetical protein
VKWRPWEKRKSVERLAAPPVEPVVPAEPLNEQVELTIEDTTMSTEDMGQNDSVNQSMENSLATNSNTGLRAANHDQNTIFQQNNSQMNELLQSLVETRRQTVALFEQRMAQENQMFQNTMQMSLQNQAAATAGAQALQGQQQSYTHQEATQTSANTVAMHYADVGAITILP